MAQPGSWRQKPLVILVAAGAAALLFAAAAGLAACASMGSRPKGARLERMGRSPNFAAGKFKNSLPTTMTQPGRMCRTTWSFLFDNTVAREPASVPPIAPRDRVSLATLPDDGLRLTWLGHASVLVEIDGYRILTDPVFSERASPVSWVGPKRFQPAPARAEDLPNLDAVVISHDHYDHLDHASILALDARTRVFVVPLGVGAHLEGWGIEPAKIVELDWWDETLLSPYFRLVATPARHFSGRGLLDRDTTLWASWALVGPTHRVYFSGDTGMFPGFTEIGERLGPFDAALMHIGAYSDAWPDIHMGPEEAVMAHQELRGGLFLPIHWGTFNLALHGWTEPAERLIAAAAIAGVPVPFPKPGESVTTNPPLIAHRWWGPATPPVRTLKQLARKVGQEQEVVTP